jgi:hypothetical protein
MLALGPQWFTWASSFNANDPKSYVSFRFSGLNRFASGAVFPLLKTYARGSL